MTKKEIVRRIAREQDLKQVQVKEMVQMTLDLIVRALCEEGRIELRNFGVFEVKIRAPRKARNPRTGEPIQVPAKTTVRFKPGKKMRELVQQSTY